MLLQRWLAQPQTNNTTTMMMDSTIQTDSSTVTLPSRVSATQPPAGPSTLEPTDPSTPRPGELTYENLASLGIKFDYEMEQEWEGYDGWYNNLAHPDWGGADLPLTRRLPVAYEDGVFRPAGYDRPNPMNLSRASMLGDTGLGSFRGRTALMTFFGQQVVEEILDAQRPGCPPEYFNIKIPEDYEAFQDVTVVNRERQNQIRTELPLLRSRYSFQTGYAPNVPREQLNEITPWFDGGLVYGISKAWADALREFDGGRLRSNAARGEPYYPEENTIGLPMANPPNPTVHKHLDSKRFFKLGNPRGNENPFLLTFGIVWFRWHNVWCDVIIKGLMEDHSELSRDEIEHEYDEYIFNEARKWVIATYQNIVYYEWLPVFLNIDMEEYEYEGYKGYIHPGVTHEFQSAAMRFGHTLVPPGVYRRDDKCNFRKTTPFSSYHPHASGHYGVRTCNSFWNPQKSVREFGIEEYLMGMAAQITEREDNIITEDLQRRVFGPLDFSRRDLMAVNIQRGRDHGLPDYQTAREALGLPTKMSVADIRPGSAEFKNASFFEKFVENDSEEFTGVANSTLEDLEIVLRDHCLEMNLTTGKQKTCEGQELLYLLDIWPGGILETTSNGPGELFRSIILDQFIRIRDADRFWFENPRGRFSEKEIEYIRSVKLKDVFIAVSKWGNHTFKGSAEDAIQDNPFILEKGDKCFTRVNGTEPKLTADETDMEDCTPPKSFDYFGGSQASFALSYAALGFSVVGAVSLLIIFAKWQARKTEEKRKEINRKSRKGRPEKLTTYEAQEWQGRRKGCRPVNVMLGPGAIIKLNNERGNQTFRTIDLSHHQKVTLWVSADGKQRFMTLKLEREYDLVLRFSDTEIRQEFISKVESFLGSPEVGVGRERLEVKETDLLNSAITKDHRQRTLEKFFRHAFASLSQEELDPEDVASGIDRKDLSDILTCELTKSEFAEMLSMKPDSVFVEQMFDLIDKDMSGAISFREFLDVIVIFAKGKADQKLKLMFDMYDLDRSGHLSRDEFKHMLKSMMDIVSASVESERLDEVVNGMFSNAGFENKEELSLDDFISLMAEHRNELEAAALQLEGADVPEQNAPSLAPAKTVIRRENAPTRARKTIVRAYGDGRGANARIKRTQSQHVKVSTVSRTYPQTNGTRYYNTVVRLIENYKRQIFIVVLYNLVLLGIFAERAYYYSVEREFAGLRTIAGYGVTVTRGAASAMMFTYSSLLVTMSRNTITYLRETFLHRFVDFDFFLTLHKMIAFEALGFSILHTIGHSINFYHISTQPAGDLTCLFRNFWHRSNELPKFHYWAWGTITGFTGILLVIFCAVIYTFALQYSRRRVFKLFWLTHNLWVVYFILMFLHGSGNLVQPPFLWFFALGPLIWYTLDKLVSIARNKAEITVTDAQLLPSGVTMLEFKRPVNFDYKSGQWVRIACKVLGGSEYHPFTLTSAPHEENLSLHIRAIGPWTINVRKTYDPNALRDHPYPKLYLDGPYGEGHQDWYQFEVSVLVGGGIGVTPFASILKDIVFRSQTNSKINCKKVYFIWVTRTQKHFEWLTDIIRDVEEKDEKDLVSTHIFITQFFQKFDLRTTMLYICERHFQKISNRSLFTGLQSVTHFGRPHFESFLGSLQDEHPEASKVGVFSCGPPGMTSNVEKACVELNKYDGAAFMHHFENF
ncbi:dual oxidase 1 precursor [Apostichopus japonicus]|uniref:NAD(P)H oxidase (H2O2-forming) n=1 Tax=Stichopus japonicus TaxID=307972 RepID=A0A2G8K850_STIJA|nr:dual oxidase 1 precursor [Apostichopus japonicus]